MQRWNSKAKVRNLDARKTKKTLKDNAGDLKEFN